MGQAQHGFQHAHQGAAGAALLGLVAGLDLHLGQFQIPVAVLVPDEFVDGLGEQVEAVVGEVLRDFLLDALQPADDPAVGEAEFERVREPPQAGPFCWCSRARSWPSQFISTKRVAFHSLLQKLR